jgi:hypothetical protein
MKNALIDTSGSCFKRICLNIGVGILRNNFFIIIILIFYINYFWKIYKIREKKDVKKDQGDFDFEKFSLILLCSLVDDTKIV